MRGLRVSLACVLLLSVGACAVPARGESRPGAETAASPLSTPLNVEIKRNVRTDQVTAARSALQLDDATARRVAVTFYDTPGLELFEAGLILRSRTVDGGGDDVTVKVRPLQRTQVAASWFEQDGFKCELDRSGHASVESCSYTAPRGARAIEQALAGERTIESLFNASQRDFARLYSPVTPDWERLRVLGPLDARAWKRDLPDLKTRLSAELWLLPDGKQLLELSTRVPQEQAAAAEAALDAALAARGLDTSGVHETKTRAALQAFAER